MTHAVGTVEFLLAVDASYDAVVTYTEGGHRSNGARILEMATLMLWEHALFMIPADQLDDAADEMHTRRVR